MTSSSLFKSDLRRELCGIAMMGFTLLLFVAQLSFVDGSYSSNLLGIFGYGSSFVLSYLFGLGSFAFILFFGWIGWQFVIQNEKIDLISKIISFSLFLFSSCFLLNVIADHGWIDLALFRRYVYSEVVFLSYPYPHSISRSNLGGVPVYFLYKDLSPVSLKDLFSDIGICLCAFLVQGSSLLFLFDLRPKVLAQKFKKLSQKELVLEPARKKSEIITKIVPFQSTIKEEVVLSPKKIIQAPLPKKTSPLQEEFHSTILQSSKTGYEFPPLSLLSDVEKNDSPTLTKDLQKQASILEETLQSFGIEAKVGQIHSGPTITSFEVHPAVGVKVQKITALSSDIALNLQAKTIRIIAPIPGKAAVGVEVPSLCPQEVGFKVMLQSYRKNHKKCLIPVLLGKTVTGEEVISDLAKMPHCIIAGATGSGKSVCINTIIMSILMNATPDEIKLILIDPKKVELTPFSRLPHLIAPVITEAEGAHAALQWIVKEMERRYELLKQLGLRNISAFNYRKINTELESSLSIDVPEAMPMIIAIIDEFADLMMTSSADLETPIARIAQMARAVGIHLILATQRPSREVITGIIKANFPTRIAFKVASRVNSQIILDENGAETLLGNGDMLFLPPGSSQLIRAQGVYIRDEDINRVIDFIEKRYPPRYLFNSFDKPHPSGVDEDETPRDSLYERALETVLETGNASTTFLQRKLKIGYARAASLIDELEERGVISTADGARPRRVLMGASIKDSYDDL